MVIVAEFFAAILISVLIDLFPVLNLQLNKCAGIGIMFENRPSRTPLW